MGVDFLNRTKKTITKCVDTQRVALATHHLFTVKPGERPRSYVATVSAGINLEVNDTLIAELSRGSVQMSRGNEVVATLDDPSSELIDAIQQSGGVSRAVVNRVHKLSRKAGVELC